MNLRHFFFKNQENNDRDIETGLLASREPEDIPDTNPKNSVNYWDILSNDIISYRILIHLAPHDLAHLLLTAKRFVQLVNNHETSFITVLNLDNHVPEINSAKPASTRKNLSYKEILPHLMHIQRHNAQLRENDKELQDSLAEAYASHPLQTKYIHLDLSSSNKIFNLAALSNFLLFLGGVTSIGVSLKYLNAKFITGFEEKINFLTTQYNYENSHYQNILNNITDTIQCVNREENFWKDTRWDTVAPYTSVSYKGWCTKEPVTLYLSIIEDLRYKYSYAEIINYLKDTALHYTNTFNNITAPITSELNQALEKDMAAREVDDSPKLFRLLLISGICLTSLSMLFVLFKLGQNCVKNNLIGDKLRFFNSKKATLTEESRQSLENKNLDPNLTSYIKSRLKS